MLKPLVPGNQQPEPGPGRQQAYRMKKRIEALEAIIHGYKQPDGLIDRQLPFLPVFDAPPGSIGNDKSIGIDGTTNDSQIVGTDPQIVLKMVPDEITVHDDQGRILAAIL